MPRFYFHLTDGRYTLTDTEGVELVDAAKARSEAVSGRRGVIQRLNPTILVTDKLGIQVSAVPFVSGEDREERDTKVDGYPISARPTPFGSADCLAVGLCDAEHLRARLQISDRKAAAQGTVTGSLIQFLLSGKTAATAEPSAFTPVEHTAERPAAIAPTALPATSAYRPFGRWRHFSS